jgi:hypothetical protein
MTSSAAERDGRTPVRVGLVNRVDVRDVAIVVPAATGDLRAVTTKDQNAATRTRLAQFAVRGGPVVTALKKSPHHAQTSARVNGIRSAND